MSALTEYKSKLDELNIEEQAEKSSKSDGNTSVKGIMNFALKYKCYIIVSVGIILALLFFKPGCIQKREELTDKPSGSIDTKLFLKVWFWASLILNGALFVYLNFYCKSGVSVDKSACKLCGK